MDKNYIGKSINIYSAHTSYNILDIYLLRTYNTSISEKAYKN